MRKINPLYLVLVPAIVLMIGCPRSRQARDSGLRPEADEQLRQGNIAEALDAQVTAVGGEECGENRRNTLPGYADPIETAEELPLERRRPRHGNSDRENASICTRRAEVARSRGINKLVISFEGLGTYNNSFTSSFYDYYDDLWAGENPRPPRAIGSNVGRDLLAPNLHEDYQNADFLLFSERNGADTVEECAEIYRRIIGPQFELQIVGLSFGAGEALVLADRLSEKTEFGPRGITVANLMTVDLRGTERTGALNQRHQMNGDFQTPPNVVRHMNFGRFNAMELMYASPRFGYPGYQSRSSGVEGHITVNHPMPTIAGHATQLKTDVIQQYYREMF